VSKHINVNPDHYKVAGRERPGNAVAKAKERAQLDREAMARWDRIQEKREKKPGRNLR
jgi:hypothetical protein